MGVIGLGRMGGHHVRCIKAGQGMVLSAVTDADPSRAEALAPGTPFHESVDDLLRHCDAVVLAVPSPLHAEMGIRILDAGKHLLMEKPLAADLRGCDRLAAAAEAAGVVLDVGHVERLNWAYRQTRESVSNPRFVEAHRLGGYDPRGTEVDVVLDLMIHDLDLVLDLFGGEPDRVEAVGVAVLTSRVDIANARLEFPGGALVNLTASRVSRDPVRKMRIFEANGYHSLDLGARCVEVVRRMGPAPMEMDRRVLTAPEDHNPLVDELEEFRRRILGEETRLPGVKGGRRAVALAERVIADIERRSDAGERVPGEGTQWAAPS
ncbi:oxidoreductase [Candidatus Woesearchaeota archaeon]|jgi:predicted dehydrogenase|nr:oxidoreductase [Candidatus Woesearchaeota archaeon]